MVGAHRPTKIADPRLPVAPQRERDQARDEGPSDVDSLAAVHVYLLVRMSGKRPLLDG